MIPNERRKQSEKGSYLSNYSFSLQTKFVVVIVVVVVVLMCWLFIVKRVSQLLSNLSNLAKG